MLGRFHNWYVTNQDAITWFLIGLLFEQGLEQFSKGNYVWGLGVWLIAYANYSLRKIQVS
jgi:hypothetical protein